jgi:outer membrane protein OmpA-like peptidoglycan-associated protein
MARIASSSAVLAAMVALSACSLGLQQLYDQETLVVSRAQHATEPFGSLSGAGPWHAAFHAEPTMTDADTRSVSRHQDVVVYFEVGSATIDADGERVLRSFVQELTPSRKTSILIAGYAEATGSEAEEDGLSDRRARAVADFLRAEGIPAARLASHGVAPLDEPSTPRDRLSNRRVDVSVH